MKNIAFLVLWATCGSICLTSCGLEKEVEFDLPLHESRLVVECYLEEGEPFRLLLSESSSYFDSPDQPLINDATVKITFNNRTLLLQPIPYFDTLNNKFYNYTAAELVPPGYTGGYSLEVTDKKGRTVTATTGAIAAVAIDSVTYKYNKDSLAYLVTYFPDDPQQANYYRFTVHRNVFLADSVKTDFTLSDNFASEQNQVVIGTDFEYERGDTMYVSVGHLTKAHYDYLESVATAQDANGNPFGQPAQVKSNVRGGYGIFTRVANRRRVLILQ